jgi:hypothetical protein
MVQGQKNASGGAKDNARVLPASDKRSNKEPQPTVICRKRPSITRRIGQIDVTSSHVSSLMAFPWPGIRGSIRRPIERRNETVDKAVKDRARLVRVEGGAQPILAPPPHLPTTRLALSVFPAPEAGAHLVHNRRTGCRIMGGSWVDSPPGMTPQMASTQGFVRQDLLPVAGEKGRWENPSLSALDPTCPRNP